ncbi:putative 115 kDa protein in type-1 retrotransposable element R1DM [Trichonephila clavipes]|nr:putative 115 kDa protein in type-1 retrotransposable element R1DM [Trichonephila clavipes]
MLLNGFLLHHDNARPHIARYVLDVSQQNNVEILTHPLYISDLTSCDFWLFPHFKRPSRRKHSASNKACVKTLEVSSLKRDPQCLSPQASLILIYRPTVGGKKSCVDHAEPEDRTSNLWYLSSDLEKLAQVILIPKVSEFRVPHLDNLRCISLLPALGKCLEKLFVNRISWYLRRGDFLSSDQYGFTPHKSTEDALLRLNEIVKSEKKKHLHSILIYLDIKGAFDDAWWPCILNLLKKAEIPINIFSLVADFLNDRVAKMQLGSTSAIPCLERGYSQGSVSAPIFWNIIINDLLSKLNNLACCEIIAFADDILVCSQGRDLSATFLHTQETLNFASDWSKSFKLDLILIKPDSWLLKNETFAMMHFSYISMELP